MSSDLHITDDEREREARRAVLQAKKDEQPVNTARSYASKQREWKVPPSDPRWPPPFLRCTRLLTCVPRAGVIRRAGQRTAPSTAGPMVSSSRQTSSRRG